MKTKCYKSFSSSSLLKGMVVEVGFMVGSTSAILYLCVFESLSYTDQTWDDPQVLNEDFPSFPSYISNPRNTLLMVWDALTVSLER